VQKLVHGDHFVSPEVEDVKTNWLESQKRAAGNIIHVGKPTRLLAVAGDGDGSALSNPLAEAEHDHVWSAGRTVDRKVAQHRHIDAIEVVVGISKRFGAFLAGGIRRKGVLGGGRLSVWWLAFITVEAGSGRQDELRYPLVSGVLEHVQVAEGVGVEVAPGIRGAGANAGNGCQVNDGIRCRHHRSQPGNEIAVVDVITDEVEIFLGQKRLQAVFFHTDVIHVVEVVNPEDGVPLAQHLTGYY